MLYIYSFFFFPLHTSYTKSCVAMLDHITIKPGKQFSETKAFSSK